MSRKLILEMSVYTDGDWDFNRDLFANYTSKYFENEVYEYTYLEDHTCKIRRTFEDTENGYKEIISILTKFKESLRCRDKYTADMLNEFFDAQIEAAKSYPEFHDDIDSNTEISIRVYSIDNDSHRIKTITFTDDTKYSATGEDTLVDKTNVFEENKSGTYVISAMVKYSYEAVPKERFAGRDVNSEYSTGHSCWCDEHDNSIVFFSDLKYAEKWFHEEEAWLCKFQSAEVTDIRIFKSEYTSIG